MNNQMYAGLSLVYKAMFGRAPLHFTPLHPPNSTPRRVLCSSQIRLGEKLALDPD
jgi:hypothetical protein